MPTPRGQEIADTERTAVESALKQFLGLLKQKYNDFKIKSIISG